MSKGLVLAVGSVMVSAGIALAQPGYPPSGSGPQGPSAWPFAVPGSGGWSGAGWGGPFVPAYPAPVAGDGFPAALPEGEDLEEEESPTAGRASLSDTTETAGHAALNDSAGAEESPIQPASDALLMPSELPAADGVECLLDKPPEEPEHPPPCRRIWTGVDLLFFWVKDEPLLRPLVTSSTRVGPNAGAIGAAGTTFLFGGGGDLEWDAFTGIRFRSGLWLDPNGLVGFEASGLFLEKQSIIFNRASGPNGLPIITRPVFTPHVGETAYLDAFPGRAAGDIAVGLSNRFWGMEANMLANAWRSDCLTIDVLGGCRYLDLQEVLNVTDNLRPLAANQITFLGLPLNPPNTLTDFDNFAAKNRFYGPQIGGRIEWRWGQFVLSGVGKVAFGWNHQRFRIDGASIVHQPNGGDITVPGGILAQVTNIGTHNATEFSVVPEAGVNLAWEITSWLRATFGYTFIYWEEVIRPGGQIDHLVTAGIVPTNANFGFVLPPLRPRFPADPNDFWAQGINLGLELQF